MFELTLYGKADCELCDQAEAMILPMLRPMTQSSWQLVKTDITSDAKLLEQYGWSIPVLQRADTGEELKWPFPPSRLREFLSIAL
ncbi:glutaredoxin family protein [Pseudomonadales bacterium]|nr:glutaredoxin family protein [Pseudomonadales bacterium]